MSTDKLREAAALLKTGNKNDAFFLLSEFLKTNPESADGWYLMAYAANKPEKRVEALERVIVLNPNHARAREMLDKLKPQVDIVPVTPAVITYPPPTRPDGGQIFPILTGILSVLVVGLISGIVLLAARGPVQVIVTPTMSEGTLTMNAFVFNTLIPAIHTVSAGPTIAAICMYSPEDEATIKEFLDTLETATATSRISLSTVVLDLQKLSRKFQSGQHPDCMKTATSHIESGMDFSIQSLQDFMSQKVDTIVNVDIDLADKEFKAAHEEIKTIGGVPPDYRLSNTKVLVWKITS